MKHIYYNIQQKEPKQNGKTCIQFVKKPEDHSNHNFIKNSKVTTTYMMWSRWRGHVLLPGQLTVARRPGVMTLTLAGRLVTLTSGHWVRVHHLIVVGLGRRGGCLVTIPGVINLFIDLLTYCVCKFNSEK